MTVCIAISQFVGMILLKKVYICRIIIEDLHASGFPKESTIV